MTKMQSYALANPLARARGDSQVFRRFTPPWSVILTVNK
jgi:hypothetical protein